MISHAGKRIVVAGGSLAGHSAITELASLVPGCEPDCEIVWVTGEKRRAYSKPALSKEYMQARSEERDILLPEVESGDARLTVLYGGRCAGLDAGAKRLTLDDGDSFDFDGLIVCTGADARMPAIFYKVEGVLPLRTLEDAIAIRSRLADKPRVLVLGGGLIGCELAASMRGLGLDVTIVEQLETLLDRPFGGAFSDHFIELHKNNGVDVLTGVTVDRLVERNGTVAEAHLSDGTVIETSLVLVGAGSRPATQWLEGSGLELSNGVVCDEYLATSSPFIYAAGDVARWFNPYFDTRMRVEHWTNASAQGRAASRNLVAALTGRSEPAKPFGDVPYFWSDQYGQKVQMVGWHDGHDRTETQWQEGAAGPIVRFYRNGRFVAAAGVNAPRAIMGYRRQIELEARARQMELTAAAS